MALPQDKKEQRGAPRHRTIKGARLLLHGSESSFTCVMRNLSDTGALVELPSTLGVPHDVVLQTDDGQLNRHCRIAWRTQTRIGLLFTD
jgi:hypothetical protein